MTEEEFRNILAVLIAQAKQELSLIKAGVWVYDPDLAISVVAETFNKYFSITGVNNYGARA